MQNAKSHLHRIGIWKSNHKFHTSFVCLFILCFSLSFSRYCCNSDVLHSRSIADGQSQHSFSNHSHRGYLNSAFPTNLVNSRPGKLKLKFHLFLFFSINFVCFFSVEYSVWILICEYQIYWSVFVKVNLNGIVRCIFFGWEEYEQNKALEI